MSESIQFSKEEKAVIVKQIQLYFSQELSQEIGNFDAEFLLDFFSEELGAYYYNRGLLDAQTALEKTMENFSDSIYALEKKTRFSSR